MEECTRILLYLRLTYIDQLYTFIFEGISFSAVAICASAVSMSYSAFHAVDGKLRKPSIALSFSLIPLQEINNIT